MRTRWAAIGAAVAVTLGGGGLALVDAAKDSGDRPVTVFLDEPCRLRDTRTSQGVGGRTAPLGPAEAYTVKGTGPSGDCNVPADAVGLITNVTATDATANTNLRFYPTGGSIPETSNLNPRPGSPPVPNAVVVGLNGLGEFDVRNFNGFVNVIIDVSAYLVDHTHDDRYALIDHNHDDEYLGQGEIEMTHAPGDWVPDGIINTPAGFNYLPTQTKVDGSGTVMMPLSGPASFGSGEIEYEPAKVTYCATNLSAGAFIDRVTVQPAGIGAIGVAQDDTNRVSPGCYDLAIDSGALSGSSYVLILETGGAGITILETVTSTWGPTG
ncbi:MAG: hypothetical protein AAFY28_19390 [Actinomycetota bacterium]